MCKFPQKNLRNSSVLRRFCHPKLSKDRAIFFFYCDPLHFVAILLHSAFRVHYGVCSGGQAGGSAPMLTMHCGARIPRRPPSFAVSVKKCPAEVGNGNYRLARTGQLTLESINLNYKTGSRTICRRIPDVARTFVHEIGPVHNAAIRPQDVTGAQCGHSCVCRRCAMPIPRDGTRDLPKCERWAFFAFHL